MFKIALGETNKFKSLFENHRLHIAASNIYYQNIRLINGRHKILDRKTYEEYYRGILNDIELETSPIDSFVPSTDENSRDLFVVNQLVPEYKRIASRVTLDDMFKNIPMTHDVCMKLKENPNLLSTVVDDIYIYWCVYKYLDQIDEIRIRTLSNMTDIIEYVVNNITLKDLRDFIRSNKINPEKYEKYCQDILFNPEVSSLQKFYSEPHGDIPAIDVVNLMMKLSTFVDLKSDTYIIIGIYMTMSFAVSDITNNRVDDSPCAKYVRDVLSQI